MSVSESSESLEASVKTTVSPDKLAYGLTILGGKVHELITKEAARLTDMPYNSLITGVRWNDLPSNNSTELDYLSVVPVFGTINKSDTIANKSHHGEFQIWHSMAPNDGTGRVYSNGEVKNLIIDQAVKWYDQAQTTGNNFHLGKVLHMVQDSYSRSHVVRDENGKIKNFQSYNEQDAHEHGTADKPQIKTVIENNGIERQVAEDWQKIPGTLQALEASTAILKLYKSSASSKELAEYLRDQVYPFENEQTKDLPAGGSDPKYQKRIAENGAETPMRETSPINAQSTSFGQMGASHAVALKMAEHIPEQYHARLQELVNQHIIEHNHTVGLLQKTYAHELPALSA
ncbi:MAG: hypothetical protein WC009_07035 [Methylotenera sp.]